MFLLLTLLPLPHTLSLFFFVGCSSVVCEIGQIDPNSPFTGKVEVLVEGGKRGTSSVDFTYRVRDPHHLLQLREKEREI